MRLLSFLIAKLYRWLIKPLFLSTFILLDKMLLQRDLSYRKLDKAVVIFGFGGLLLYGIGSLLEGFLSDAIFVLFLTSLILLRYYLFPSLGSHVKKADNVDYAPSWLMPDFIYISGARILPLMLILGLIIRTIIIFSFTNFIVFNNVILFFHTITPSPYNYYLLKIFYNKLDIAILVIWVIYNTIQIPKIYQAYRDYSKEIRKANRGEWIDLMNMNTISNLTPKTKEVGYYSLKEELSLGLIHFVNIIVPYIATQTIILAKEIKKQIRIMIENSKCDYFHEPKDTAKRLEDLRASLYNITR